MFNFIKMVFNIKDVVVDRISLISRGKKPAVPKAETSFSIFKMANKSIITKENKEKLEKISQNYGDIKKKSKKTLYVNRKVKDWSELIKFANDQKIQDIIDKKELHVTVAFSKTKVNWDDFKPDTKDLEINLKNAKVEKLWDALVLKFKSKDLEKNWKKYIDGWASWDFDSYNPHISLSYKSDQDISKLWSFTWKIKLSWESMEEIKPEYLKKLDEISKWYNDMIQYEKDIEKKQ